MAHWAILIGINQYQFLQPLSFAHQDAQALQNFLISEAGFSPEHCLLLTDMSPSVQNRSTQPIKRNIQEWIDELCRTQLQPGDLLWCFFSGHGVCEQGQDYLMPIDGDPDNVAETGISIRSLFESFKVAPNSTVLTLLDMSRNQTAQTESGLGTQTLGLAGELEIATILSCAVNEVSHESPRVRNGFFTVALLEGLRNHECSTPNTLSQYLSDALPQLCEYYWQPPQHPESVLPTLEAGFELILPQTPIRSNDPVLAKLQTLQLPVGQPAMGNRNGSTANPTVANPTAAQTVVGLASQVSPQLRDKDFSPQDQSISSPPDDGPYGSFLSQLVGNPNFVRPTALDTPQTDLTQTQGASNDKTQFAGLTPPDLKQREVSTPPDRTPIPPRKSPMTSKDPAAIPPLDDSASEIPDALFWRKLLVRGALGSSVLLLGVIVFNPDMFAKQSPPQPTPSAGTIAPSPSETSPGLPTLTPINSLNVPTSQQSPNRRLLDEARAKLTFNQAAPFAEAINQARQAKKGDPQYTQALQDIDRWSLVILDLAEGQAKRGKFETAINTVNLLEGNGAVNLTALPEERPEIRTRARELASNWEIKRRQQQVNGQIITNAQQLIRAKQAFSYHQAIVTLRKIPPNQPGYLRSQDLTKTWSEEMLRLAKERAAQSNFRDAIRAADLVPANAPNYTAARESIALWRNRVSQ